MVNLNNLFLLIENQGLSASKVSAETGISTGNISDWKKGRSMPTAQKLDILAEYFNCSVDYLLGRTDNPNVTYENVHSSNIVNGSNGDHSPLTVNEIQQDEMTTELVKAFRKLNFADKMEIMNLVLKKTNK